MSIQTTSGGGGIKEIVNLGALKPKSLTLIYAKKIISLDLSYSTSLFLLSSLFSILYITTTPRYRLVPLIIHAAKIGKISNTQQKNQFLMEIFSWKAFFSNEAAYTLLINCVTEKQSLNNPVGRFFVLLPKF